MIDYHIHIYIYIHITYITLYLYMMCHLNDLYPKISCSDTEQADAFLAETSMPKPLCLSKVGWVDRAFGPSLGLPWEEVSPVKKKGPVVGWVFINKPL